MNYLSIEEQQEIAKDTLNILVPIASKLRLNYIKSRVEDLCLYYLKPDVYYDIVEKLNANEGDKVKFTYVRNEKEYTTTVVLGSSK